MAGDTDSESFEKIVEWAYGTLPQTVRDEPDFPGIQVAEEPPPDILKKKSLPPRSELLGCYSGVVRTKRRATR